jgi:hypothetical protein
MDQTRWSPGRLVIHRSFEIAAETDELCRPIHILAALQEVQGPVSAALTSPIGRPLLPRLANPKARHGGGASFLAMQTQEAAGGYAAERGEIMNPEHLLLAVIDQRDSEALEALDQAGIDLATVRRAVLEALDAPSDLPSISMPPLTPAGSAGRPRLSVEKLNNEAWSALCLRQDHLPLHKIKRPGDYDALRQLESRAAWRISSTFELDDDQRYSLLSHHSDRVEQRAAQANSEFTVPRSRTSEKWEKWLMTTGGPRRRRPGCLMFTVGWGTWFANRRIGLRNKWFHLRTMRYWRHATQM